LLRRFCFDRAAERKVELLKSYGLMEFAFANPPSEVLNARQLVFIDESFDCWRTEK
jgi:hypothetical protein